MLLRDKPLFPRTTPGSQRKRATPAGGYLHGPMADDHMIFWLAQAAKEVRLERGRKQVHIAATINRDQSTVNRFEQGEHWPRDPDEIVLGYAEDLELNPRELWERALQLWANGNDV